MKANETDKGTRRFFAIASVGKSRWYWVVWPSLAELEASEKPIPHIADGVEETKAEAVQKGIEVAGRCATWIAGKYAKSYYQNSRAGTTRIGQSAAVPVLHEFLYRDLYDPITMQWESVPHRVVRRTSKYVYVEQLPSAAQDWTGTWLDGERPTYRLDRQALEQQGYAFIPATADLTDTEEPLFFTYARNPRKGDHLPACFVVLHLSWPCTVSEVQEAYRTLVKSAHPDGGGSHEKFLELQAAYEQALRMCR